MTLALLAPVSPGELLDKLSILDIKLARITDPGQLANVEHEHRALTERWQAFLTAEHAPEFDYDRLDALQQRLSTINQALWAVEDDLRECERRQAFDAQFIDLARSVYRHNDQRAEVKKQINLLLGSDLIEEKSYAQY